MSYLKLHTPVAQGNFIGDAWRATKEFVVGKPATAEQKAATAAKKLTSKLAEAAQIRASREAQQAADAQKQMVIIVGGVTFGVVLLAIALKKPKRSKQ